jgi:hypothetical protein
LLADDRVASTLPNIYDEEQLVEFAKAPETAPLTSDEMAKIEELYSAISASKKNRRSSRGPWSCRKETRGRHDRVSARSGCRERGCIQDLIGPSGGGHGLGVNQR